MNKLITLTLLFLPLLITAQEGTTLEEYRFLTKGYPYQISMGLDIEKKGYELKELVTHKDAQLIGFYKNGQSNLKAMLMIVQTNEAIDPTYICIPNKKADKRVSQLFELDKAKIKDDNTWSIYNNTMEQFAFQTFLKENDELVEEEKEAIDVDSNLDEGTEEVLVSKGVETYNYTNSNNQQKVDEFEVDESINTLVEISIDATISERGIIEAPIIRGPNYAKGIISVKFCLDRNGEIIFAKYTQKGSNSFNPELKRKAIESVNNSTFAKSDLAEQCGIITFKFN